MNLYRVHACTRRTRPDGRGETSKVVFNIDISSVPLNHHYCSSLFCWRNPRVSRRLSPPLTIITIIDARSDCCCLQPNIVIFVFEQRVYVYVQRVRTICIYNGTTRLLGTKIDFNRTVCDFVIVFGRSSCDVFQNRHGTNAGARRFSDFIFLRPRSGIVAV